MSSKKRLLQFYKPDSVSCRQNGKTSIIYLAWASRPKSICLPPLDKSEDQLSEQLNSCGTRVYMAFQPTRFILPDRYLPGTCALTARFHPYPTARQNGRYSFCDTFCLQASYPEDIGFGAHPLDGVALCVVRTFLISSRSGFPHLARAAIEQTVANLGAKILFPAVHC